jgi:hypothetical protein
MPTLLKALERIPGQNRLEPSVRWRENTREEPLPVSTAVGTPSYLGIQNAAVAPQAQYSSFNDYLPVNDLRPKLLDGYLRTFEALAVQMLPGRGLTRYAPPPTAGATAPAAPSLQP